MKTLVSVFILKALLLPNANNAFSPPQFTSPSRQSKPSLLTNYLVSQTKPYFADYQRDKSNNIQLENKPGLGKTAIIAGATGYIGRAVVRECISRGYHTVSLVRNVTYASTDDALEGSSLVKCDVTNVAELNNIVAEIAGGKHLLESSSYRTSPPPIDLLVSCLASPSGIESEVYSIDYSATLSFLNAGRSQKARHFVLLSAFCCRNPLLKLQQAKLAFEAKLASQSEMTYSIVRPTAFFKSVSGQFESIMKGNSYVLFGDGEVTRCNPICERDLATYMCDCALEQYKEKRWGKILNIGGPDGPLSNRKLAEMMFESIGKQPKFVYVPTQIFDVSIGMIAWIAKNFPSQKWEDVLETAKIGKYYAVEDMLTTVEDEKFGRRKMMDHFEKVCDFVDNCGSLSCHYG
jgi:divinyl chlorophyllide a 8-vinyl-reductase